MHQTFSRELLRKAIRVLDLSGGTLLPASAAPQADNRNRWLEKGDWLALASRLGAEAIFFVDNEPVVVLAELPEGEDVRRFFNRIWYMARPQLLFLASPGKLEAYQLTTPPVRPGSELCHEGRLLALATTIAEIQERFRAFQRDRLETGTVYGDKRFASGSDRADRALFQDLRAVREQLIKDGLDAEYARSLIARALFIRYLEDRKIIVSTYFRDLARGNEKWENLLAPPW